MIRLMKPCGSLNPERVSELEVLISRLLSGLKKSEHIAVFQGAERPLRREFPKFIFRHGCGTEFSLGDDAVNGEDEYFAAVLSLAAVISAAGPVMQGLRLIESYSRVSPLFEQEFAVFSREGEALTFQKNIYYAETGTMRWKTGKQEDDAELNKMEKCQMLPVRLCLGSIDLTPEELLSLRPGGVIELERTPQLEASLRIGDCDWIRAKLEIGNDYITLKLMELAGLNQRETPGA